MTVGGEKITFDGSHPGAASLPRHGYSLSVLYPPADHGSRPHQRWPEPASNAPMRPYGPTRPDVRRVAVTAVCLFTHDQVRVSPPDVQECLGGRAGGNGVQDIFELRFGPVVAPDRVPVEALDHVAHLKAGGGRR